MIRNINEDFGDVIVFFNAQQMKDAILACGYAVPSDGLIEDRDYEVIEEGSREWAVAMVGEKNVNAVEEENCEPTNRVGGNGLCQNDTFIEEAAAVQINRESVPSYALDHVPYGAYIRAMYRISNDLEQRAKDAECSWWDIADIPIYEYRID